MGWYTNYEVEFSAQIDWDEDVKNCLKNFNVEYVYLRDLECPRVIMSVYSTNPIETILEALKSIYHIQIHYRIYDTSGWNTV